MDHLETTPTGLSPEHCSAPNGLDAPVTANAPLSGTLPGESSARLDQMAASVLAFVGQVTTLERSVQQLREEVACIPDSLRQLGRNVQGLATSVAEPRMRSLLLDLLVIVDLVDQAGRACVGMEPAQQWFRTIGSQMRQTLHLQGLVEIVATGRFDPTVHRAVEGVKVTDPEQDEQVVRILRCGFRTERVVLRAADVVVARHVSPPAGSSGPGPATFSGA